MSDINIKQTSFRRRTWKSTPCSVGELQMKNIRLSGVPDNILQCSPTGQTDSHHHEIIKFLLAYLFYVWFQDLDTMLWRNKTKKTFYQSYPGIFTDITTHDFLILDPQLTSLCSEKRYKHRLLWVWHKPWRNKGDFRVAHPILLLIHKWPGQVSISRGGTMNRLHNIKNSESILIMYNRSSSSGSPQATCSSEEGLQRTHEPSEMMPSFLGRELYSFCHILKGFMSPKQLRSTNE